MYPKTPCTCQLGHGQFHPLGMNVQPQVSWQGLDQRLFVGALRKMNTKILEEDSIVNEPEEFRELAGHGGLGFPSPAP